MRNANRGIATTLDKRGLRGRGKPRKASSGSRHKVPGKLQTFKEHAISRVLERLKKWTAP